PGIAAREALAEAGDRETRRVEVLADLGPVERRGDRRLRAAADGVRGDDRLPERVPEGVEVDAAAARRDPRLDRELLRIRLRQALAEPAGEVAYLVAVRAGPDRDEDVQAACARRLGERDEVQSVKGSLETQAGARGVGEAARRRIEVEADPVGLSRRGRAAVPDVHRDAAEVRERELRLELPADDVVDVAGRVLDSLGRRVGRKPARRLLLVEAVAAHPFRAALERQQAIADVRLERGEDLGVEADEVELGETVVRPIELVGVADAHLASARRDVRRAGRGRSRGAAGA